MYCIGIDGGGTNVRCVIIKIVDAQTKKYEQVSIFNLKQSTNPNNVGREKALENLKTCMDGAIQEAKQIDPSISLDKIYSFALAMSGVGDETNRLLFVNYIKNDLKCNRVIVENDAVGALASATLGDFSTETSNKAVLICGTGMIAVGTDDNGKTFKRTAGWGPLLGDVGSGYWFGSKLLAILTNYEDGAYHDFPSEEVNELQLLQKQVFSMLNIHQTMDLIPAIYSESGNWGLVASFAELVLQSKSNSCKQIIEEGVKGLYDKICMLNRLFTTQKRLVLVLSGSVVTHANGEGVVASLLKQKLQ